MNAQQCRNTVALLQSVPLYYRNFGIWWWHIKAELKRNGFDRDQLHHLGDYTDPSVLPYYEGMTLEQLDHEAFSYQYDHTFDRYNQPTCFTPDGEEYLIRDQDAE